MPARDFFEPVSPAMECRIFAKPIIEAINNEIEVGHRLKRLEKQCGQDPSPITDFIPDHIDHIIKVLKTGRPLPSQVNVPGLAEIKFTY